jgi:hypothetical protein
MVEAQDDLHSFSAIACRFFVPLPMAVTVMTAMVTTTVAEIVTPAVVAIGMIGITRVRRVAGAVIPVTIAIIRTTRNDYSDRN